MKKVLVSAYFLLFCVVISAQKENKNTVSLIVSPLAMTIYDYKESMDGGGSYDGKGSYNIGLEYSYELFSNFEVVTGLLYTNNKINVTGDYHPGIETYKGTFHLNYLSIPIQAKYKFLNFLFVNGGGIVNFRVSDTDSRDGNKFGLLFGVGAEYDFGENLCFQLNPYFQMNDFSSNRVINFFNLGVKVGVGYKF